jgi:ATP-binding cassette subfamily F protein 3
MPLVSAAHVSMHYGGPLLLDDVTLKVESGARVGLIGRNGCGKSTLLRILAGRLEPASGQVVLQRGATTGYQAQELEVRPGVTVLEEMRAVFGDVAAREARLREVERALAEAEDPAEREALLARYERLQLRQEAAGAFDVERRIATTLTSLGLPASCWDQPLDSFSGGERNVIGLARVLLAEPDLCLLDEPSNHLDMDGVEWFIGFVRRSPAAVLMVSHNRHLLDAVATEIWELRDGAVRVWPGNYSDFQRQKAEALALQERQYRVQQRLIQRIEFQARRLKDMANAYDDPGQAKRAKAMLARLDRMEKVERPAGEERRFRASLAGGERHGRIALSLSGFSCAHGDRVLFEDASLELEYGDRVCLVGPNGSGKTTLMRHVLEQGSWENPACRLGRSVKVGEYRQLHDALGGDEPVVAWLMAATGLDRPPAEALLYRFLFAREDLERPVRTLSGGEKSRLQLARLAHEKVNFLLLDEPTNHLDIEACEVLEEMLTEYDGTLLVISHDRYFLDRLVERVVEVKDRRLVTHRMTFAEWWQERSAAGRTRRGALEDRSAPVDKEDARREYAARKERRRELTRLQTRVRTLEERIAKLEERLESLKAELERLYAGGARDLGQGERLGRDLREAERALGPLYVEWEAAAAELDRLQPEAAGD